MHQQPDDMLKAISWLFKIFAKILFCHHWSILGRRKGDLCRGSNEKMFLPACLVEPEIFLMLRHLSGARLRLGLVGWGSLGSSLNTFHGGHAKRGTDCDISRYVVLKRKVEGWGKRDHRAEATRCCCCL